MQSQNKLHRFLKSKSRVDRPLVVDTFGSDAAMVRPTTNAAVPATALRGIAQTLVTDELVENVARQCCRFSGDTSNALEVARIRHILLVATPQIVESLAR